MLRVVRPEAGEECEAFFDFLKNNISYIIKKG